MKRLLLLLWLLPTLAFGQNDRENLFGTKALRQFGQALTANSLFGVPRYTTALLPTCDTLATGALSYDTTTAEVKRCNGTSWAAVGGAQVSGDNTWTGTQTFKDNKFIIEDDGDATKDLVFQLSGITTGNTVTPNVSGTGKGTFEFASVVVKSTGAGTPAHFVVPALTALTGADNICIGTGSCASSTTGTQNVVIGPAAGDGATTGMSGVTCVGYNACTGSNIGINNTAVGNSALDATSSTAAVHNAAFGTSSCGTLTTGASNTCLGQSSGGGLTAGSENTHVGFGTTSAASASFSIALGSGAAVTASNQMVIGGSGEQVTEIYWSEGVVDASPLDVTHNATGGTGTDIAGADLRLAGGKGTGNAAGGDYVEQTSVPGATGTTLQTLGDRVRVLGKYTTLTDAVATDYARCNLPTGTAAGGMVSYTVEANDATDFQSRTGWFPWSAVNKAGTLTTGIGTDAQSIAVSAGTLTCTATLEDATGGNLDFQLSCTSSLTETVLRANAQVYKNFGVGACSAL